MYNVQPSRALSVRRGFALYCFLVFYLRPSPSVRRVSAHARLPYTCIYNSLTTVATMDHQSTLRRRKERERERRAHETPEQREARLSQRRLRDGERARERLAAETAEEREARLARRRVRDRARRAAESGETELSRLEQLPGKANCCRVQRGERDPPATGTQESRADNCCRVQRGERGPPPTTTQESRAENCCRVERGPPATGIRRSQELRIASESSEEREARLQLV